MVSPYINHFIQPDTIIPDLSNPQSWNRYSYVYNNPILYNDPSGHCPWCASALIGGALGFFGSVSYQVADSLISGKSDNFKEAFQSVDWKSVAVYTVAGAVAGGTFGALSNGVVLATGVTVAVDTTTVAGAALAGGVSSVAGGQAAALTDATWDLSKNIINDEEPELSYDADFMLDAYNAGFLNGKKILFDFAAGAFLGGLGQGLNNLTRSTGSATYVTQAAREKNALLPGIVGASTRATSEYAQELSRQWLGRKYERMEALIK